MEGSRMMMLAGFGMACTNAEAKSCSIKAAMINSMPYRPRELIDKGSRRVFFGAEVEVSAATATAYDCASWGNPDGPKIYMLDYFFKRLKRNPPIDLMAAMDQSLKLEELHWELCYQGNATSDSSRRVAGSRA